MPPHHDLNNLVGWPRPSNKSPKAIIATATPKNDALRRHLEAGAASTLGLDRAGVTTAIERDMQASAAATLGQSTNSALLRLTGDETRMAAAVASFESHVTRYTPLSADAQLLLREYQRAAAAETPVGPPIPTTDLIPRDQWNQQAARIGTRNDWHHEPGSWGIDPGVASGSETRVFRQEHDNVLPRRIATATEQTDEERERQIFVVNNLIHFTSPDAIPVLVHRRVDADYIVVRVNVENHWAELQACSQERNPMANTIRVNTLDAVRGRLSSANNGRTVRHAGQVSPPEDRERQLGLSPLRSALVTNSGAEVDRLRRETQARIRRILDQPDRPDRQAALFDFLRGNLGESHKPAKVKPVVVAEPHTPVTRPKRNIIRKPE